MVVFLNVSVPKATKMKIQRGFVVFMINRFGSKNIVQYGSGRGHRVTLSVKAAEAHAYVHAPAPQYVIQKTIEDLKGQHTEIGEFVNSRNLCNIIPKNNNLA